MQLPYDHVKRCIWEHLHPVNKKICLPENLYTIVPTAIFVIAPNWKKLRCPLAGGWLNKWWYIHTMEHYSTVKRNKLLLCKTI